jgi:hypothetical protein
MLRVINRPRGHFQQVNRAGPNHQNQFNIATVIVVRIPRTWDFIGVGSAGWLVIDVNQKTRVIRLLLSYDNQLVDLRSRGQGWDNQGLTL